MIREKTEGVSDAPAGFAAENRHDLAAIEGEMRAQLLAVEFGSILSEPCFKLIETLTLGFGFAASVCRVVQFGAA